MKNFKNIILTFLLVFPLVGMSQQVTLSTQAEVNAFTHTSISGNLIINDTEDSNITNLTALGILRSVGGALDINYNDALSSLSGLEGLTSVGGLFRILNNDALSSLSGLDGLTRVGSDLIIQSNATFTSLSGLDNINHVGNHLYIWYNSALTSLSDLDGLTSVVGDLSIRSNAVLGSLSGLENIMTLGGNLYIGTNSSRDNLGNPRLINLCGVRQLITNNQVILGEYFVEYNAYNPSHIQIQEIDECSLDASAIHIGNKTLSTQDEVDAFSRVTSVTGNLKIDDTEDSNIINLTALRNLRSVEGFLEIQGNASLSSLSGLEGLTSVGVYLTIWNNTTLSSLSGLDGLTRVGGDLRIWNNPALSSLSGLEGLTHVGGYLMILTNAVLTSLSGLSGINHVGRDLRIWDNIILSSLSGLENIMTLGGNLSIGTNSSYSNYSNPKLVNLCDVQQLITNDQVTSDEYFVRHNGHNPSYIQIETNGCSLNATTTFIGNKTFGTQAEIAAFSTAYTHIIGNLTIEETSDDNIGDLSNLSNLTNVGGNLTIESNTALTSLSGLNGITRVGGDLNIYSNTNTALTSLSGLNGITRVERYLRISSNSSLSSLSGLNGINSVGADFNIHSNLVLTSLNGLESLTRVVGGLQIYSNVALSSLSSLNALNSVGRYLRIYENDALSSLSGLDGLTRVGEGLQIYDNVVLSSLSGLNALNSVGGYLQIASNSVLTSLSGLEAITSVGGYLQIASNSVLTSLSGLEAITSVGGYLQIASNSVLTSLSGLEAITSVGGYLQIASNPALIYLSGLDGVTSVGGNLRITSNSALTSLSSLENITTLGGSLNIGTTSTMTNLGNPNLDNLCGVQQLITDSQVTSMEYYVMHNGYNPDYDGIQVTCANPDTVFTGDVIFINQVEIDDFDTTYTSITGNLTIQETVAGNITDLGNLGNLNYVGGNLVVNTNTALSTLSGLDGLNYVGGTLNIQDNAVLINYCAIKTVIGDGDGKIVSTEYIVNRNGYTPLYAAIQETETCVDPIIVFTGDVTFTNQGQISAFATTYTSITGNLTIQGEPRDNITNLSNLGNLTHVGGNLLISGNTALSSLSGLNNLNRIGGNLEILNNTVLSSLSGLDGLNYVGGSLSIQDNAVLINYCAIKTVIGDGDGKIVSTEYIVNGNGYTPLYAAIQATETCVDPTIVFTGDVTFTNQGQISAFATIYTSITGNLTIQGEPRDNITDLSNLDNLTHVGGNLLISGNTALSSLSGLEGINSVGGYLNISYNDGVLRTLSGLDSVTSVGGNLSIAYNAVLETLNGLESITYLGGSLLISSNIALSSLRGLSNIPSVGGYLSIQDNPALSSLIDLENITSVGEYMFILNNATLSSLSGLNNITSMGGDLDIKSNVALTSLSGLNGIPSVGGDLNIRSNAALTSLSGLDGLTGVGGNLNISSNDVLTSLIGLGDLTGVGGNLSISSNTALTSLSGLDDFASVGGYLRIRNNEALINFCAIQTAVGNGDGEIASDEYTVINNGYNPTHIQIQDDDGCSATTGGTLYAGSIVLTSQTGINNFSTTYTSITGNLTINETMDDTILNLDALSVLRSVGGYLSIYSNTALSSLSGLENITILGSGLYIGTSSSDDSGNPNLANLCGVRQLINDEQVTIEEYSVENNGYNPSYAQIQEAISCSTTYTEDLTFENQVGIDAFPTTYTHITGDLTIQETLVDSITNLDGLNSLISVDGNLFIYSNAVLSSLSGLENIITLGGSLNVGTNSSDADFGNSNLTNLCGIRQLITEVDEDTEYFVMNNGYSPSYAQIQNATSCNNSNTVSVGDFIEKGESIVIYPNPAKDILHIESEESITFVEIINTLGQVVLKTTESKAIHIGFLPSGVYFVKVTEGTKATLVKILKN